MANESRYRVFLKVAETGSISRAAEALQYTQSGVSHIVRSLEEDFGVKLLIRHRSGVELTDKGERILPYLRRVVQEEDNLKSFTYHMNNLVAGCLRIGSFSSVTEFWMPELVMHFKREYPDVELVILDGNYDEIRQWIRQGIVDLGFLSAIAADELQFVPLYDDPLCVIMPTGHPLEEKRSVTLEEIVSYPLIMETPGCDNDIKILLERSGLHPSPSFCFRDDFEIAAFVEKGIGISISQELVQKAMHACVSMRPLDPPCSRMIGIGSLKTQNSILTSLFIDYMKEYLKKDARSAC